MALATNLVAYYKLDGNSNDVIGGANGSDTSVTYSNLNGIINNGAGLSFASSSYITIAAAVGMGSLTKSISAWFKTTDSTHEGYIFNASAGLDNSILSILRLSPGTISFLDFDHGGNNVTSTSASYNDGNFHHVVATVNAGTAYTIYVDGVQVQTGSGTARSGISGISDAAIGTRAWSVGAGLSDLAVDEIGVWTRELTAGEVTTLYNGGLGNQYPFVENFILAIGQGSFSLSGQSVGLAWGYTISLATGLYTVLGNAVIFHRSITWNKVTKNVASFTKKVKNTAIWTKLTKS